jgi:hypothetical protein
MLQIQARTPEVRQTKISDVGAEIANRFISTLNALKKREMFSAMNQLGKFLLLDDGIRPTGKRGEDRSDSSLQGETGGPD